MRVKTSDYHGWGCSVKLDTTIRGRLEWHIPIHCMRRFAAAARVPAAGQANALRVDMRKYAKHLAAACEKNQSANRNRNKGECCVCSALTYFVCPLCSPGGVQNNYSYVAVWALCASYVHMGRSELLQRSRSCSLKTQLTLCVA